MNFPRDSRTFSDFIYGAIDMINIILPVLVALALFVFFKGLANFIYKSGDSRNHKEGRDLMVWGLVALFIMVSFLGIINVVYRDVGFTKEKPFGIPFLPER